MGGGLVCAGLLAVGLVVEVVGSALPAAATLFLIMLGMGLWDVAMNLEGAGVERRLRRTIMPRFHAAFSRPRGAGAARERLRAGPGGGGSPPGGKAAAGPFRRVTSHGHSGGYEHL